MMGLARGQTARISLLALEGGGQFPPNPCVAGTPGFFDAAGRPYTDANGKPIAAEFALFPGQTTQRDLLGADAFRGSQAMRREIRPAFTGIVNPDLSCAMPLLTVEIFDVLTGRTQVLHTGKPDL